MDYTGLIQRLRDIQPHENPLIAEATEAIESLWNTTNALQHTIREQQHIIQQQALENQALRNRSRKGNF